ncbi:Phosphoglucan, water dikinase protein [Thalictrum thalictroides]|uniref:Phosphoglucan, water dikinase protein n=1 Tax=Thalictrum thalictroides TaxID=46969 RepID=A0A7J6WCE5_THATH|nr:Phosphoglucan, water dikinase protein [Thalictrum thalictroides]
MQANVANAEALTESTYQSKTIHVKFLLQKECSFGDQFLLVGDDPSIGQWNPASAIPLNWSDEHIWTVELDLPVGQSIHFKFILKNAKEELFWQPGADRVLQTWETKNTIVVLEDWENAEIQNIAEEPNKNLMGDRNTELIVRENIPEVDSKSSDNKGVTTVENISCPEEKQLVNEPMESPATENAAILKQKSNTNPNKVTITRENKTGKEQKPSAKLNEGSLVAENISGGNGIVATDQKLAGTQDKDLVGFVGDPVLVPGLSQLPKKSTKEDFSSKSESKSGFDAPSRADEADMPKPYEYQKHEKEEVNDIQYQEDTPSTIIDNESKEKQHDNELKEEDQLSIEHELLECQAALHEVVQNDFQWGHKTLLKLLTTLGFSLDQT